MKRTKKQEVKAINGLSRRLTKRTKVKIDIVTEEHQDLYNIIPRFLIHALESVLDKAKNKKVITEVISACQRIINGEELSRPAYAADAYAAYAAAYAADAYAALKNFAKKLQEIITK